MGASSRRAAGLVAVLASLACGCGMLSGLVGTRVEVRGARQTLEEQVLGSFARLGEEVFLLAGVRSVDPITGVPEAPPPMTASEARALAARRRMEFNRDDVRAFLRAGYVGERNNWQLVTLREPMIRLDTEDPRTARLLREIVEEENADRRVILQRLVDTTPELDGQGGLAAAARVMAAAYRREAETGVNVQLPDGAWLRKGEGT
jgi:hypothetical protein